MGDKIYEIIAAVASSRPITINVYTGPQFNQIEQDVDDESCDCECGSCGCVEDFDDDFEEDVEDNEPDSNNSASNFESIWGTLKLIISTQLSDGGIKQDLLYVMDTLEKSLENEYR